MSETEHEYGSLYPNSTQRRFVLTALHKNCGGQVIWAWRGNYKAVGLKQDGTLGCALCHKQPIGLDEVYEDYR